MYQYGNLATEYNRQKSTLPVQKQQKKAKLPGRVQPKREQQTHQVEHKPFLTPLEKGTYLLFAVIVLGVLGMMLMNTAMTSQLSYEAQFLERELANIEERNSELRLQIALNSSPDRIKEVAEKNGFISGSTVRVLSISLSDTAEQAVAQSTLNDN